MTSAYGDLTSRPQGSSTARDSPGELENARAAHEREQTAARAERALNERIGELSARIDQWLNEESPHLDDSVPLQAELNALASSAPDHPEVRRLRAVVLERTAAIRDEAARDRFRTPTF